VHRPTSRRFDFDPHWHERLIPPTLDLVYLEGVALVLDVEHALVVA
jgi:hypothetical protein